MKNKEIEEILNYMKQYVENIYEHDSEPMLNYKDLQIVLSYIEQLEKENDRLKEVVENLTTMTVNGDTKQIKNTAQYKLEQLENNRDKAIEYVESHFIFNDKTGECYQTYTFDKDNVKKLYDILKGDSDESRI